ncbi:homocysteine S-methyltransferase family protein [Pedococcus sp. KACC 23699]|uniref:Homocysteine S-methyltransferase family protein n=1 Tax=Pedococcus sp. KACC 23699 TaxID=3149228 RepID=A0AAU7JSJ8_9MICO
MRLTDGGLETSLIFHQGIDLPDFAAFPLLDDEQGRAALRAYWAPYLELARETGADFLVDTATWRANADWGDRLGYDAQALHDVNTEAVEFARELTEGLTSAGVVGVVGPRGDGYVVGHEMTVQEAATYHRPQVRSLAAAGADHVALLTITYVAEAVGFVRAARDVGVPCVASFTVETDGRLPSGVTLRDAVEVVDHETDGSAMGFMVNCAHPDHVASAFDDGEWVRRVVGFRGNASRMSHAELDAAEALDPGDPEELAQAYAALLRRLPSVDVVGGCCGTDDRHVRAIAATVLDHGRTHH